MLVGLEQNPSRVALVGVAVGVCALQDTVAFIVFLRANLQKKGDDGKGVANVLWDTFYLAVFCLSLLLGVGVGIGISHDIFVSNNANQILVPHRSVMAGIFVYMACF